MNKNSILSGMLLTITLFALMINTSCIKQVVNEKMIVPAVKEVTKNNDKQAPNFTWEQDGKTMNFADISKGKVTFVNFWATWCPPCRREIPDIIKLNKDLKDKKKDVVFIGIGLDRDADANAKLVNFVNSSSFNYPVYHEPTGKLATAFGGADAIPTTYIIGKNGEILEKIVGMRSYEEFETAINNALKK
jgi:thiol-disulfide isomerase/thioredoxin